MLGHRIHGKRLGIVGMGRIGSAVARRARGFGLSVHYHNRRPVHPELEAELEATYWDNLDQMVGRMDLLSGNCPHTPATYHLITRRRLGPMPPPPNTANPTTARVNTQGAPHEPSPR